MVNFCYGHRVISGVVMQPQVSHMRVVTPVAALSMLYITPCQIYAFHVTLYKFHLI